MVDPFAPLDLPDGYLSRWEVAKLQELARGKFVLEFGAHLGRSTVAMAQVAPYVNTVDNWLAGPGGWDRLESVLARYGVLTRVRIDSCSTWRYQGEIYPDRFDRFDGIFIDADHSYDACLADCRFARAEAAEWVAVHDYCERWPTVVRAAKEALGFPDEVVDTLAVWRLNDSLLPSADS